jgi:hypothetical protein
MLAFNLVLQGRLVSAGAVLANRGVRGERTNVIRDT